MTVLDRSVANRKLLMVMARKTIHKPISLNAKYHYAEYDPSLKDSWCSLHFSTGLFENMEQADRAWNQMVQEDELFLKENFLFVLDDENHLVGSAGLWKGFHYGVARLRLHYVSVLPQHQNQGIAKSMITSLCVKYDSIPSKYPLYLSTQTQSYGAIALYSRLGFTPFLGEYQGCSEEQSQANWEVATKILKEKANLKESC